MPKYAVVGDPIAHSKSPQIHQMFAGQFGEQIDYVRERVSEADFAKFVRTFFANGGSGLNVTLPHKEAAFSVAKRRTAHAKLAKAANTLWLNEAGDLCADTTDGKGIVRDLSKNHGVALSGKKILILGAGGAARGALAAIIGAKPSRLLVLNRSQSRAESLQQDFASAYGLAIAGFSQEPRGPFDVIINATSAGIKGEFPKLHPGYLGETACCYDMIYGDKPTAFMEWGKAWGAQTVLDGLGMLVEQAAESYKIWRGARPETAEVIAELRGEISKGISE